MNPGAPDRIQSSADAVNRLAETTIGISATGGNQRERIGSAGLILCAMIDAIDRARNLCPIASDLPATHWI